MKDKQRIRFSFKFFTAILLSIASYYLLGLFAEEWSHSTYDLLFRLRGPLPKTEDIVIVAVDETSFDELNMQWPWPRSVHGKLLDSLFDAGAKAVALDFLFAEPSSEKEDVAFAEAVERYPSVVLGLDFTFTIDPNIGYQQTKIVSPDPILTHMETPPRLGFVSVAPEADGYLRRIRLVFPEGRAFALEAAEAFRPGTVAKKFEETDAELRWINFSGPARSIPTALYYQALDPQNSLPPNFFKDKLVFVGLSSGSEANIYSPTADHFLGPFSREDKAYIPGVEVHANAARSILEDNFIRVPDVSLSTYAGLFLGFDSAILFLTFPPLISTIIFGIGMLVLALSSVFLFGMANIVIAPIYLAFPFALSYLACPFIHYWFTFKQKNFIRKAFSTYLAPSLVAELINHPERLELGGSEIRGTVVFLDLAGFTGFSEMLAPKDLIDLINRNLGACAEYILKWDGMIDKYIGDCIMAVWGVPVPSEDHAFKACSAVAEIFDNLKELADKERALTGVGLSIRVGINTGNLVAGNVGGGQQFNYTVLGNEVNLASRLEGTNKGYHTDIIVSEATKEQAGDTFVYRELDVIRVVGQKVPVKIYQLWGKGTMSPEQAALNAVFQEARALYRKQDWSGAKKKFAEALELQPNDGPCQTFIARCDEYELAPPEGEWDGVHQMRTK